MLALQQIDEESGEEEATAEGEIEAEADPLVANPRRYFNQQLRHLYRRVTFPVHQPFPATPAAIPRSEYRRTLHKNGTAHNAMRRGAPNPPNRWCEPSNGRRSRARWCHSVRTPKQPSPNPLNGSHFRPLADLADDEWPAGTPGGGGGPEDSRKKPKTSPGAGSSAADAKLPPRVETARKKPVAKKKTPAEDGEATKRKAFTRAAPREGLVRTVKIRMWPTPQQTRELKRVFAVKRWAWNWCNTELKQRRMVPDERNPGQLKRLGCGRMDLRNHFRHVGKAQLPAWAGNVSDNFTTGACYALSTAWTNGYDALREGRETHFDIDYQCADFRTKSEVLKIEKHVIDARGRYASSAFNRVVRHQPSRSRSAKHAEALLFLSHGFKQLGGIRMQDKSRIIDRLLAESGPDTENGRVLREDAKIRWDKRARSFHFIYTYEVPKPVEPDPTWESYGVTSLDGGIRGFQTFCNMTTGQYGELVCGFKERIHDRVGKLDDLHSRVARKRQGKGVRPEDKQRKRRAQRKHDRINAAERRRRRGCQPARKPTGRGQKVTRLNRRLRRERVRQTNWVEAVHYDAINFQLSTSDVVINPVLRTGQMAPRQDRVFGSDSCRAMCTMSHGKYDTRLRSKAEATPGKHVIGGGEPGTTRTCPSPECGRWHVNLGGNHIFTCPPCGIVVGRDDVGARGNGLAALGRAQGVRADATSQQ